MPGSVPISAGVQAGVGVWGTAGIHALCGWPSPRLHEAPWAAGLIHMCVGKQAWSRGPVWCLPSLLSGMFVGLFRSSGLRSGEHLFNSSDYCWLCWGWRGGVGQKGHVPPAQEVSNLSKRDKTIQ